MLFLWNSSAALSSYAPGKIFVDADSVEQARRIALIAFEKYLQEEMSWLVDDEEQLNIYRSVLMDDLRAQPERLNQSAVFVRGSD